MCWTVLGLYILLVLIVKGFLKSKATPVISLSLSIVDYLETSLIHSMPVLCGACAGPWPRSNDSKGRSCSVAVQQHINRRNPAHQNSYVAKVEPIRLFKNKLIIKMCMDIQDMKNCLFYLGFLISRS